MSVSIRPVPVLRDNYAWLIAAADGTRAVVDPGEAAPVEAVLGNGLLDLILLTHHHADHTAGAERLRARYDAKIYGPAERADLLPPLDRALSDGDEFIFGATRVRVLRTPGHAVGHVCYFLPDVPALFCGDVLFSAGCGRLLEGTAAELFASLRRFDVMPDETLVCAGHEYTKANLAFALHVDPHNEALKARAAQVDRLLAEGRPTLPVTLGVERETNPFLRAADVEEFARLRRLKDQF